MPKDAISEGSQDNDLELIDLERPASKDPQGALLGTSGGHAAADVVGAIVTPLPIAILPRLFDTATAPSIDARRAVLRSVVIFSSSFSRSLRLSRRRRCVHTATPTMSAAVDTTPSLAPSLRSVLYEVLSPVALNCTKASVYCRAVPFSLLF